MKVILEGEQITRTIRRMSHEIIEKNNELDDVVLIGIKSKGTPIARIGNMIPISRPIAVIIADSPFSPEKYVKITAIRAISQMINSSLYRNLI